MTRALGVIPARGGSKRLPRKNLRELGGRPMIAYTVEAALGSGVFETVIVSTDDAAIAEVARGCGAEVPFVRRPDLANDHAHVSEVALDALQRLDPDGSRFDVVAQLLPNCPLRTADDVRASQRAFEAGSSPAQLSVTRYGWLNPWWAMRRGDDGRLSPLFPDEMSSRSQDLPLLVCPTGAVWWARADALREHRSFHMPLRTAFELPWERAIDIDDEADLRMAEVVLELSRREGGVARDRRISSGRA